MNINPASKYRLRIVTSSNIEYLSAYVPVQQSPAIDSVYWEQNGDVNIYANTHDPQNNTRYYRWDYLETWEHHAYYETIYGLKDNLIFLVDSTNQTYKCWSTEPSHDIVVGTSIQFSQDIINKETVGTIPQGSVKLSVRYSMLLKQYALTKEAFQFWENLQKNTQQLGSIFDAQPSQLIGNIHNLADTLEPVIGYMSAGTVSKLRKFIPNSSLPPQWTVLDLSDCLLASFYFRHIEGSQIVNDENFYFNYNQPGPHSLYIPISTIEVPFQGVVGHTGALPPCADCTLRGSNKPPAFWQ